MNIPERLRRKLIRESAEIILKQFIILDELLDPDKDNEQMTDWFNYGMYSHTGESGLDFFISLTTRPDEDPHR